MPQRSDDLTRYKIGLLPERHHLVPRGAATTRSFRLPARARPGGEVAALRCRRRGHWLNSDQ